MARLLALTAALWLSAPPAFAGGPLVFHRSNARAVELLPVVHDPRRPWLKSTPEALSIDLRDQWEPTTRDQGNYGTCSAFAAVAVAEAAVGRNGGLCTRLSEADLYLQANVLRWDCWSDARKDCRKNIAGMAPGDMLQYLVRRGVLPGDDYKRFIGAFEKALDDDHDLAGRAKPEGAHEWLMRLLRHPLDENVVFGPNEEIRRQLERYAASSRSGDLSAARRGIARQFRGYRVVYGSPENVEDRWEMKPGRECEQHGRAAGRFIDGELLQGRPVAVGMYLDGIKQWPGNGKGFYSSHAFVIDGLTLSRGKDGIQKVYRTRNSWRQQPPVTPDELCRVFEAVSLWGPRERAAPENPWAALR